MGKDRYEYGFERLQVWQEARELAVRVFKLTEGMPSGISWELAAQMRKSALSIPSNIAEGSSRTSGREQARFYSIAYGSAIELLNQLIIAKDLEYLPASDYDDLRERIHAITWKIFRLRNYAKKDYPGVEESEGVYSADASDEEDLNTASGGRISTPEGLNSERSEHQPSNPKIFIHPSAIVDEGAQIGEGSRIWHFTHVMGGAVIGRGCSLGQNVFVAKGVVLGDNVKVQNNVSIYEGVICEDDVFLGPSMVFTNVRNPRSAVNRKNEYRPTRVGRGASIGANATIVCGHDIGEYAFIGAGAVVTKDVPPYALVVGNPARQIGWMSRHGERLHFDDEGRATCPGSGEEYRLWEGKVEWVST